jgi:hypothetical protein
MPSKRSKLTFTPRMRKLNFWKLVVELVEAHPEEVMMIKGDNYILPRWIEADLVG